VLNRGMTWASTELVAFVNSDAILLDDHVLRRLADAVLGDERCAGAYARQLPRPEASAMTRLDYHIAFECRHQVAAADAAMSLVCSVIRRSAWKELPFHPELTYAEDCVWASQLCARGWSVGYVAEARVEHSHEYRWSERYRRAFGDAAALALLASRPPPGFLRGCVLPFAARCLRDAWRLMRMGSPCSCWRLPAHRWPMLYGRWRGSRAGWQHFTCEARPALQPVG
jgi:rhamnosyltransferase